MTSLNRLANSCDLHFNLWKLYFNLRIAVINSCNSCAIITV
jgi:hypothetical protein